MKFYEVCVHTASEGSELVADVLWRYSSYGVAISDVADVIALQNNKSAYWDYIDDDLKVGGDVLVKAFIPKSEKAKLMPIIYDDLNSLKSDCVLPLGSLEVTLRETDGDDWLEVWKTHFKPLHIGEKIVVCPEWIKYDKKEGEQVILLDSNMAFGTGEHETTAMCLKLLQKYLRKDFTLIDVGCGSGILGLSAIKLGAKYAYLSDIDEVAVKSAAHNAKINGLESQVEIVKGDLSVADIKADIVVANITAEILCRLAPTVPKCLKKGGTLILSGIIGSRLDMVLKEFGAQSLKIDAQLHEGEWYALAFKL